MGARAGECRMRTYNWHKVQAPPVASISHEVPQHEWSREVVVLAAPGSMIKEPAV